MQALDQKVIQQAKEWLDSNDTVWLCTVLSTYGSSPREPGSLFAAKSATQFIGSLSGGCVEEDFLERIESGEFNTGIQQVSYGSDQTAVKLPCGGSLIILVEQLTASTANKQHFEKLFHAVSNQNIVTRVINLSSGKKSLNYPAKLSRTVTKPSANTIEITHAPPVKLILAGVSSITPICAQIGTELGYEVIVCDPNKESLASCEEDGVHTVAQYPSEYLSTDSKNHDTTAVVALTHDPRLDDLTMIEAVRTDAFYIGVMGSKLTSEKRAIRLKRSGGLSEAEINRIHMPIGLALGSKTPAEIAVAVIADIVRVHRGVARDEL